MHIWLAKILRKLATRIDGRVFIPIRVNAANVKAANLYVRKVEPYVVALEALLPEEQVKALREKHGRFDTSTIVRAWEIEREKGSVQHDE